ISVRNVLMLLGRIFEDARREHYLRTSPMIDVEKTKVTRSKKAARALTYAQAQTLLAAASDNEPLRLILLLMLLAGVRRSECFALHWTDIDWDQNILRVERSLYRLSRKGDLLEKNQSRVIFTDPKTDAGRREIDLSPILKKALRAFFMKSADKQGLVFQTPNG